MLFRSKAGEALEFVDLDRSNMQYLYKDADNFYFMDNKSYEQYAIPAELMESEFFGHKKGSFTGALQDRVKPDGIDLVITRLTPSEMFWRQLKFGEFDASEMSMSSLIMAIASGDERWTGIPVFTTRRFYHSHILVRRDAGIDKPADLKGKRVGVHEYQQTAALWTRGVLEHEFGVTPRDMPFWMERIPSHSHRGAVGFDNPPGVTIHQIPAEKDVGGMMLSGELQAAFHYSLPEKNLIDRSRANLFADERIKPLFPDPAAEGARYFAKTGIFPINHAMVLRRSLFEKYPWAALSI